MARFHPLIQHSETATTGVHRSHQMLSTELAMPDYVRQLDQTMVYLQQDHLLPVSLTEAPSPQSNTFMHYLYILGSKLQHYVAAACSVKYRDLQRTTAISRSKNYHATEN